jgi:hypothetical protein
MTDVAHDLIVGLTAAYAPFIMQSLQRQGIDRPGSLVDSIREGEEWLRATLAALLDLPFVEQRRGPLEVFQEAMRFPTAALAAAGVEAVARDPGAVAALPGDLYGLAPASSRQLGEEVWTAHLVWGAAKARMFNRPRRVGLVSVNLMDRTRIEGAVVGSGSQLVVLGRRSEPTGAEYEQVPELVLVDVTAPDAMAIIGDMKTAGARVVAFGPHVNRASLRSARQAGADEVLARSVFFDRLGRLVG